jgi:hypothetical protein
VLFLQPKLKSSLSLYRPRVDEFIFERWSRSSDLAAHPVSKVTPMELLEKKPKSAGFIDEPLT